MSKRSDSAPFGGASSPHSAFRRTARPHAANDNDAGVWPASLTEALRLFARYGAAAGNIARLACWQAERHGDRPAEERWLAIREHFDAPARHNRSDRQRYDNDAAPAGERQL
ncbi:hypothetical protein [Porphyrobacter sp. GA68]|uniref:hypothetical protein n=1 Tax=Porphyrobacter sp. GA68 TaxID=2883480 RepID=UPI001D184B56|nr:hypothetical protein [Porphyrobacter sp. GA68]